MRVADYISQYLANQGIRHIFMVTGGGAMHLNDALGRNKAFEVICCHHEQACSMAAESYARVSGKMAAVNVTTGPGGTNAITGVYGAFVDSIPMFVVSGQVKRETLVVNTGLALRQLGDQEIDIIRMVKGITKYAELVQDPLSIRYHLEKAFYLARTGRPGPVWLDIPIDVQATPIDVAKLKGFDPKELESPALPPTELHEKIQTVLEKIQTAERPTILVGAGVRLSGSHDLFIQAIEKLGIPVTTCWNAHDALWNSHPLYAGRPGTIGDRSGNFAVQNADLVLVLGSRLNIRQISYNYKSFAHHAYKVMVDIDPLEMQKPTLKIDMPICADLKDFFKAVLEMPYAGPTQSHRDHVTWCKQRVEKYPTVLKKYWDISEKVNPYCFVNSLFEELKENDIVVTGDGTACVVTFQAANLKSGQRLYTNSGCASMGYDLPGAIGASFANPGKRIVCLAGDGSMQMNLQEFGTIKKHKLPLKIFVLNNQGYHSIRQTQHAYFPDNIVGCGEESGLSFPDLSKIAEAYGMTYRRCESHRELKKQITETISSDGAQLCEVVLDLEQSFSPKITSKKLDDGRMVSSPLEDMAPFLPQEEFTSNMLVPKWEN